MPSPHQEWSKYAESITAPFDHAFAVTPNDSADLAIVTRGIMVNVAGDVSVIFVDSDSAVTLTLLAGIAYPFRIKRVRSTNTTATGITGLV